MDFFTVRFSVGLPALLSGAPTRFITTVTLAGWRAVIAIRPHRLVYVCVMNAAEVGGDNGQGRYWPSTRQIEDRPWIVRFPLQIRSQSTAMMSQKALWLVSLALAAKIPKDLFTERGASRWFSWWYSLLFPSLKVRSSFRSIVTTYILHAFSPANFSCSVEFEVFWWFNGTNACGDFHWGDASFSRYSGNLCVEKIPHLFLRWILSWHLGDSRKSKHDINGYFPWLRLRLSPNKFCLREPWLCPVHHACRLRHHVVSF